MSSPAHLVAGATGADAHTVDARHPDPVQACVSHAVQTYGRLDGTANRLGSLRGKARS